MSWKINENDTLEQHHARRAADEQPILNELEVIGFTVSELGELRINYTDYSSALPILEKHFDQPHLDQTKEDIARLFNTKEAMIYWDSLVKRYLNADPVRDEYYIGGLACALFDLYNISKSEEKFQQLVTLSLDTSRGDSRIHLIQILRRKKDPNVLELVKQLATDPDLEREIKAWKIL